MIQPSNLLPNCAEGSLAKKDTFLGQVGLSGPDFESNNYRVSRLELHCFLKPTFWTFFFKVPDSKKISGQPDKLE